MLAYAQLLRLPNVFTAFADIALAAFAAGYLFSDPGTFALLLTASGCLYSGGMVWNDIFDRHGDALTRGFRPIPSGRVSLKIAVVLALLLTVAGVAIAAVASDGRLEASLNNSFFVSIILVVAILLYDAWLKHTPIGPVSMGLCRSLNILLGLSGGGGALALEPSLHLAATTGFYIVGVTWFARREEGRSAPRHLMLATVVIFAALVLASLLPMHQPPGTAPFYFPYLVVLFGTFLALKLVPAIQSPQPLEVQAAVKRCILGLILLDAVLASVFAELAGLLIILLLLPARWLGQWVYST